MSSYEGARATGSPATLLPPSFSSFALGPHTMVPLVGEPYLVLSFQPMRGTPRSDRAKKKNVGGSEGVVQGIRLGLTAYLFTAAEVLPWAIRCLLDRDLPPEETTKRTKKQEKKQKQKSNSNRRQEVRKTPKSPSTPPPPPSAFEIKRLGGATSIVGGWGSASVRILSVVVIARK